MTLTSTPDTHQTHFRYSVNLYSKKESKNVRNKKIEKQIDLEFQCTLSPPLQILSPAVESSYFSTSTFHFLEVRSTSRSTSDILRTPPVHHSLKPSLVFAQREHSNQLPPSCRVQKLLPQVCSIQLCVDPVNFHLSIHSGLL